MTIFEALYIDPLRFWICLNPANPPNGEPFGVVDENEGGVVYYTHSERAAQQILRSKCGKTVRLCLMDLDGFILADPMHFVFIQVRNEDDDWVEGGTVRKKDLYSFKVARDRSG